MTLAGIGLFYSAPRLCRNVFFHYTTGVGVGMAFSLLLLCYLAQRKVGIYVLYLAAIVSSLCTNVFPVLQHLGWLAPRNVLLVTVLPHFIVVQPEDLSRGAPHIRPQLPHRHRTRKLCCRLQICE